MSDVVDIGERKFNTLLVQIALQLGNKDKDVECLYWLAGIDHDFPGDAQTKATKLFKKLSELTKISPKDSRFLKTLLHVIERDDLAKILPGSVLSLQNTLCPLRIAVFQISRKLSKKEVEQLECLSDLPRSHQAETALSISVKLMRKWGNDTSKVAELWVEMLESIYRNDLAKIIRDCHLIHSAGASMPVSDLGDAEGETEEMDVNINLCGRRLNVVVEPSSQQFFNDNQAHAYNMNRNPRGLALIVNVKEVNGAEPRIGTDVDRDNLRDLLTQLFFDVIIYNDNDGLTAAEIKAKVQQFSTDPRHDDMDACIVCLLSHGDEGFIFGTDGERVRLAEIYDMFDNRNCPALIDKPKVFIIQACRGPLSDEGVPYDEEDAAPEPRKVPRTSDMLKCFPTQAFYKAFRDTVDGSWFVEAIVKIFMNHAKCEDVSAMMNRVNDVVSTRLTRSPDPQRAGRMQMSEYQSTLRKPHLYLFPGISINNPQ